MAVRKQQTSLGGLPIQIDYTARDFEAIRSELLSLATQLTPEWTDREAGDIGVTILEAVSYVADILSYQIDRVQNESYLATAQTREAVVDLLRLINYEMAPASPATVAMAILTSEDNVTLPVGFTVKTPVDGLTEPQEYQLTEAINLPLAGLYCVDYQQDAVQSFFGQNAAIENSLLFVAGEGVSDALGSSNGTASQTFVLPRSPVCLSADGLASIRVTVGPETYTAQTSFVGAESDDAVFVYRFTADQQVLIKFGDGVNGKIPPTNDAIVAFYRINGGLSTNRAGIGSITDHDTLQGVSSVYNIAQPSGGSDPETIREAKVKGPRSLRALDRCVTLEDFESMAMLTPSGTVRTARAVKGDGPLIVDLYIAVQGDNPVPTGKWFETLQSGFGTIGAVGRWINSKKPVPTKVNVLPCSPINPYFEATVYVNSNLLRQSVSFDVDLSLQLLFNEITADFGEDIPLSRVMQAIENTRGVDYVDVEAFHRFPKPRYISGSEAAFDGATFILNNMSPQMQRATYKLVWSNYDNFRLLRENNSFVLDENGKPQVFYVGQTTSVVIYNSSPASNEPSQLNQFDLSVSLSLNTPSSGDTWEFSVDEYLGNIEAADHEILVAPIGNDGTLLADNFNLTFVGGI